MARTQKSFLSEQLAGRESSTIPNSQSLSTQAGQINYFDEGTGFAYIKSLGSGAAGTVSLVKSTANDNLYVRKEDINGTVANFQDAGPSSEIQIAKKVKHIPGVAQCKGWVKYDLTEARHMKTAFYVSYWDYHNFGTLWDLHILEHSGQIRIPDHWIFSWFVSMLRTIHRLHRAGVAHHDAHGNNWFLNWDRSTTMPTIVLGDFGSARVINNYGPNGPRDRDGLPIRRELDYVRISGIMQQFSQSGPNGRRSPARQRLQDWAYKVYAYADKNRGQQLESIMARLADWIEEDLDFLPNTAFDETNLVRPAIDIEPPLASQSKPYSKHWKVVEVTGDTNVPESLQTPNMAVFTSEFSGEGDWDKELNPRQIQSLAFI